MNIAWKLLSVTIAMIASLLFSRENLGYCRKSNCTKQVKKTAQLLCTTGYNLRKRAAGPSEHQFGNILQTLIEVALSAAPDMSSSCSTFLQQGFRRCTDSLFA